ncbi:hypothetical protein ACRRTK_011556 [Alexandromys fortis]
MFRYEADSPGDVHGSFSRPAPGTPSPLLHTPLCTRAAVRCRSRDWPFGRDFSRPAKKARSGEGGVSGRSFYGSLEDCPLDEDEDAFQGLGEEDEEIDQFNDDTFGSGAVDDDWQEAHERLAELEEKLPAAADEQAGSRERDEMDLLGDHEENLAERLSKMVIENELEDPAIMTAVQTRPVLQEMPTVSVLEYALPQRPPQGPEDDRDLSERALPRRSTSPVIGSPPVRAVPIGTPPKQMAIPSFNQQILCPKPVHVRPPMPPRYPAPYGERMSPNQLCSVPNSSLLGHPFPPSVPPVLSPLQRAQLLGGAQNYFEKLEKLSAAEEIQGDGPKKERTKLITPQVAKLEHAYKPVQFEGSLGKLTVSSVNNPRKMIDAVVTSRSEDDTYSLLLDVEDYERRYLLSLEEERPALVDERKHKICSMYDNLRGKLPGQERPSDDHFVQIMCIRKGKRMVARILPFLSTEQAADILMATARNLPFLIKKDAQDEFGLSLLLILLSRGEDLQSSDPAIESTQNNQWTEVMFMATRELLQIPQAALAKPISIPTNLVSLFSRYVDRQKLNLLETKLQLRQLLPSDGL